MDAARSHEGLKLEPQFVPVSQPEVANAVFQRLGRPRGDGEQESPRSLCSDDVQARSVCSEDNTVASLEEGLNGNHFGATPSYCHVATGSGESYPGDHPSTPGVPEGDTPCHQISIMGFVQERMAACDNLLAGTPLGLRNSGHVEHSIRESLGMGSAESVASSSRASLAKAQKLSATSSGLPSSRSTEEALFRSSWTTMLESKRPRSWFARWSSLQLPVCSIVAAGVATIVLAACLVMLHVLRNFTGEHLSSVSVILQEAAAQAGADAEVVEAAVSELELQTQKVLLRTQQQFAILTFVVTGMSIVAGCALGAWIARPMKGIARLMHCVGDLDSTRGAEEAADLEWLRMGTRSRIWEIGLLQASYRRLRFGIELFTRYIPETVVRGIVRGDEQASRLHVESREVTVMFSDIRDFTGISESLSRQDLLFILTRYLSVMTRIVESYEGVVAEILGDGLLVFWNAPSTVDFHAAKACAAALAQQQVMSTLNSEFCSFGLPEIAIRIGLSTGMVLSGNIGSDVKMKFGAIGDSMNLASRLEGLCKLYEVGVICSKPTRDALEQQPQAGFVCRQLDLVQVKGKTQATPIYEVIGLRSPDDHDGELGAGDQITSFRTIGSGDTALSCGGAVELAISVQSAMNASTKALQHFEGISWNPLKYTKNESRGSSIAALGTSMAHRSSPSSSPVDPCASVQTQCSGSSFFGALPLLGHRLVTAETCQNAKAYEEALLLFQEGKFVESRDAFREYVQRQPLDWPAKMALNRVASLLGSDDRPLLSEEDLLAWTGVRILYEK